MPTKTQDEAIKLREAYPNAWIPIDEGDQLEGTIASVTRAWSDARNKGQGDGWYPLLQVQTTDGPILAFHAFSHVSYNEVMEHMPVPGERIVVTYQGVSGKAKPGQNPAKLFHISLPSRDPKAAAAAVYSRLSDGHGGRSHLTTPESEGDPADGQSEFGF
jgi:hypothetical protein